LLLCAIAQVTHTNTHTREEPPTICLQLYSVCVIMNFSSHVNTTYKAGVTKAKRLNKNPCLYNFTLIRLRTKQSKITTNIIHILHNPYISKCGDTVRSSEWYCQSLTCNCVLHGQGFFGQLLHKTLQLRTLESTTQQVELYSQG